MDVSCEKCGKDATVTTFVGEAPKPALLVTGPDGWVYGLITHQDAPKPSIEAFFVCPTCKDSFLQPVQKPLQIVGG